jgi:hypothetical protein
MFASKVAKTPTKSVASPANELALQRPTLAAQRSYGAEHTIASDRQSRTAWNFGEIPIHPPDRAGRPRAHSPLTASPSVVQTKLIVGETNDPLEHEADRVADQVMRVPESQASITAAPPILSRKCAACEEEDRTPVLQRKAAGPAEPATTPAPAIVHEVLRSAGQPLDAGTRSFFEPRFQHDFGRVRVHVGGRETESAQALNALAYTVGTDIVFAASRYEPHSAAGRRLLAHELTHVVQQSDPLKSSSGQPAERRHGVTAVTPVGAVPPAVQRQAADVGMERTPVAKGRRRPMFADRAAVQQAEQTRLSILDAAINQLGPVFEAMKRQRANEPTRPFEIQAPVAGAMRVLGLKNTRIDVDTAEGAGTVSFLNSAFQSLVRNRSASFADIQIGSDEECASQGLYGLESSFGGAGGAQPIVFCPVFFGARDECQAYILMHEYFHKAGLVGHGEVSLAAGAESREQEVSRRGYKPGYLVASPSTLATFAWMLATGKDPQCSEQSEVIQRPPTNPKGPVV